MDEAALIAKLLKIEALHAGATTEGERAAAAHARERIIERLAKTERVERAAEYKVTLNDGWEVRVFIALARRYGIDPYRYKGQRRTTIMVKVTASFFDTMLWPEFKAIANELSSFLDEVTTRVISAAIHGDRSDASERAGHLPRPK